MKRRDILKQSALFAGAALSAGTIASIVSGCKTDAAIDDITQAALSSDHLTLIGEIAERIIPKTNTPGAKDAKVDEFINRAVTNNFTRDEATRFKDGLTVFNTLANDKFSMNFVSLSDEEKDQILTDVVADHKSKDSAEPHIWPAIKGLVITGYFTSEIAAKETLKYDPIPGEWVGCIDYEDVGGLWAI